MLDPEVISTFYELQRYAKHRDMYIEVDEYRAEFHVYDTNEKKMIGSCNSLDELASIIHDTWKDANGKWMKR